LSDDPQQLFLVQAALCGTGGRGILCRSTRNRWWCPPITAFCTKNSRNNGRTLVTATQTNGTQSVGADQVFVLAMLAKTNELYYLHPSFGYYFEQFYLEPHGLVYKLKTLPADTLLPPLPDKNLIAENEAFWSQR
jgi:hypothetical protein